MEKIQQMTCCRGGRHLHVLLLFLLHLTTYCWPAVGAALPTTTREQTGTTVHCSRRNRNPCETFPGLCSDGGGLCVVKGPCEYECVCPPDGRIGRDCTGSAQDSGPPLGAEQGADNSQGGGSLLESLLVAPHDLFWDLNHVAKPGEFSRANTSPPPPSTTTATVTTTTTNLTVKPSTTTNPQPTPTTTTATNKAIATSTMTTTTMETSTSSQQRRGSNPRSSGDKLPVSQPQSNVNRENQPLLPAVSSRVSDVTSAVTSSGGLKPGPTAVETLQTLPSLDQSPAISLGQRTTLISDAVGQTGQKVTGSLQSLLPELLPVVEPSRAGSVLPGQTLPSAPSSNTPTRQSSPRDSHTTDLRHFVQSLQNSPATATHRVSNSNSNNSNTTNDPSGRVSGTGEQSLSSVGNQNLPATQETIASSAPNGDSVGNNPITNSGDNIQQQTLSNLGTGTGQLGPVTDSPSLGPAELFPGHESFPALFGDTASKSDSSTNTGRNAPLSLVVQRVFQPLDLFETIRRPAL